jgi:hypothetical protein
LKTTSGIHGVIDAGHEILTRYEALTRAHHAGLDLVEVNQMHKLLMEGASCNQLSDLGFLKLGFVRRRL